MAEDIRLISLELNNYRQFYGEQRVDFSSREEGFTTLLGKNGEGKSNLLNAISWCFYKKEPHGKKQMNMGVPVLNIKYLTETKEEHTARTSVKVLLQKGNEQYSISRILTVLINKMEYEELSDGTKVMKIAAFADDKVPVGCQILPEQSNLVISRKGEHDSDFHDISSSIAPETMMREILPEDLSVFYLLDGEFLEGFWNKPERIEQGIEQISQLHLLAATIKHMQKLSVPSKGLGQDTDSIIKQIQLLSWYEQSNDENGIEAFAEELRWKENPDDEDKFYHRTGKERIADLTQDTTKMKNRLKSISRDIGNVSIGSIKILKKDYDDSNKLFDTAKAEREIAETAYRTSLVNESPFLFLKGAIENSLKIIEAHQNKGELPNETKVIFTSDLLERGTCICHTDLKSKKIDSKETNEARINVEEARKTISEDVGLDIALKMRYSFKHKLIDNYNSFLKTEFADPRKNFSELETKCDELNIKLKGISSQMGSAGDDITTKLIKEQDYLLELIDEAKDKITKEKLQLSINQKKIGELKVTLEKRISKNQAAKKLNHELKIWDKSLSHLITIHDELKQEIRIGVQEQTWKIFTDLLDNSNEFVKFVINPDYSVVLLDQYNVNKIIDISAGQSLILTLAFVSALRGPTGYKFPLVIDSPLGKIDGPIKYNIGQMLPDYLPKEQIIFLATDTEYSARIPLDSDEPEREIISFGALLEKKIPVKHFRIKKGNEGNSTISPAKLEYDKSKFGWEVIPLVRR